MVYATLRENRLGSVDENGCPAASFERGWPYAYQHPELDPNHPRYEPPHLRHQPGDTWIIDTNRPYDPDDPGPYGSPNWQPDKRTGRHRRDELPDPLPPGAPAPEEPTVPRARIRPLRHRRFELDAAPPQPARFDQRREEALARFLDNTEQFARANETWLDPGRWERAWKMVTGWGRTLIGAVGRRRAPDVPVAQPNRHPSPGGRAYGKAAAA